MDSKIKGVYVKRMVDGYPFWLGNTGYFVKDIAEARIFEDMTEAVAAKHNVKNVFYVLTDSPEIMALQGKFKR